MLKSLRDTIIVTMDKAFEDEIVTESGIKFYKDTTYNAEWSTTCIGKVVSAPAIISKRPDLRGLSNEVNDGDTIFFSYMVVFDGDYRDRDTFYHENLFYHEGKMYWKVDYVHYLGKVVDGQIVPAQGFVFLEEIEPEPPKTMLILPDMVQKSKPKGKAKVTAVGKNKNGEPELSLEAGEIVRFNDRYACRYEVLGKKFIVMPQTYLMAKEVAA